MEAGWEFRVLGPIEARHNGAPAQIRAAKQRTVLAMLLIEANRVVPVEMLATGLWGRNPPAGCRNTVQNYVLRLRRALVACGGPDPVRTRPHGYLVELDELALDVGRFDSLVAQAKTAAAEGAAELVQTLLSDALALWRGRPLMDAPSEHLHRELVPALDERRLDAVELRVSAAIASGRHRDVLSELHELTTRYPLREQFWAQRMIALCRCGRQAEALDCFRTVSRLLGEELGIDPSAELQRLHHQVLARDPELAAPAGWPVGGLRIIAQRRKDSRPMVRITG
jgi:DNA-binding SARP family transcriptional activator